MEVFVTVHSMNLLAGESKLTTESFLTMVAMGENNKPTPVPGVYPETEHEKNCLKQLLHDVNIGNCVEDKALK